MTEAKVSVALPETVHVERLRATTPSRSGNVKVIVADALAGPIAMTVEGPGAGKHSVRAELANVPQFLLAWIAEHAAARMLLEGWHPGEHPGTWGHAVLPVFEAHAVTNLGGTGSGAVIGRAYRPNPRGYSGDCPWEVSKGNEGAGCGDGDGCPYC